MNDSLESYSSAFQEWYMKCLKTKLDKYFYDHEEADLKSVKFSFVEDILKETRDALVDLKEYRELLLSKFLLPINKALKFTNKLNGLKQLYCSHNPQLSELPKLPDSLQRLDCYNNPQLSELPELPNSLQWLDCSSNPQLSELPKLPDSIIFINIKNTPVAQDREVIAKLEEFKKKHPTAEVLY